MTEQRNFRSAYLEKVGIKGVEEKKSLEILLKEQPLNIIKLNQFCIRFPVPASYRPYLWKVLLGTIHLIIARFCLLTNMSFTKSKTTFSNVGRSEAIPNQPVQLPYSNC